MGHANDARIEMAGMASGLPDDAFALGPCPDKERADGFKDAGLIWVEATGGKLRAWL
jgi:hypothetical protein